MTLGPHLLGRKAPQDDAHLAYTFAPERTVANVEIEIARPTLSVYDQGDSPECVGYSISKIVNYFNHYAFDAHWLYTECKKIDGWPNEDGTSARYAADVLRREGHWRVISGARVKAGPKLSHGISSNRWATSVDSIRTALAAKIPVPIGIEWRESWFDPMVRGKEYWLQEIASAGQVAGGHEIGIWAASDQRQAFGLSNTWGSYWPKLVYVSYATVQALLAEGGDACILNDLATR